MKDLTSFPPVIFRCLLSLSLSPPLFGSNVEATPAPGAPTPVVTGTLNPSVAETLIDNCDLEGMPGIKDSSGTRCCPQVRDAFALFDVFQE